MGKKQQKVVLPPELPPDVPEEDIEVSDEDFEFVQQNPSYAGFVSNLNTDTITKHVTRVADADDGILESLHEKRLQKKLENNATQTTQLEVDPVDALPVKTLDGKLYYRKVVKEDKEVESEAVNKDPALVKLRKPEKHAKLKKLRKEAKKQPKEEEEKLPQAEVLDEVKKELTAEEARENKKYRLAELGTSLLVDPESNIKLIKEMLENLKDGDSAIVILALKSLLAVFKDIIPGYRIRLPTEKEKEMKISKAVKKTRLYEFTLLTAYKAYVQKLVTLQRKSLYKQVAIRCLCTLLAAVPHFNFRESLLAAVVENISSHDDTVRKLCCNAIKSLFTNEGKHGGEVTVEAVKLIADLVKAHDCELHPESVEVFLSLSFDEDLGKSEVPDSKDRFKNKKFGKRKSSNEINPAPDSTKKIRKENLLKTREEVNAEFKVASLAQDPLERRKVQTQTLSAVFETFFRILRHAGQPTSETNSEPGALGNHPLLAPCLNGIGKFSHLLDLDFMADLMQSLRKLAGNGLKPGDAIENPGCQLSVSERLQCCIVAFKVMRNNLDALNIDLQEFFVQFYNLILEFRPGRDQGGMLAEALKIMLCDDRQHDMQRAAAFIKRLCMFSLCFGSAESLAALVTVKHLLQRNVKCRSLLENDIGGGLVAGAIAKYQPQATDPNRSGALASVLWELNLLSKHYHPAISSIASSMSTMATSNNQVYHSHVSPQQAYSELLLGAKSVAPTTDVKAPKNKRKRKGPKSMSHKLGADLDLTGQIDQEVVEDKLAKHFVSVRDFEESKRLRSEVNRTANMLKLYQEYRAQKKKRKQIAS